MSTDFDAMFARFMAIKVRELAPLVRSGTLTLDDAWLAATGGMSTEDSDGAQARRDFDAAIAAYEVQS